MAIPFTGIVSVKWIKIIPDTIVGDTRVYFEASGPGTLQHSFFILSAANQNQVDLLIQSMLTPQAVYCDDAANLLETQCVFSDAVTRPPPAPGPIIIATPPVISGAPNHTQVRNVRLNP